MQVASARDCTTANGSWAGGLFRRGAVGAKESRAGEPEFVDEQGWRMGAKALVDRMFGAGPRSPFSRGRSATVAEGFANESARRPHPLEPPNGGSAGRPAGKKRKAQEQVLSFKIIPRRRPTLPRGLPRSTIGAEGLNGRVRNGNGCGPFAKVTGKTYAYIKRVGGYGADSCQLTAISCFGFAS